MSGRARIVGVVLVLAALASSCSSDRGPTTEMYVTRTTDGSTYFLEEGLYSVSLRGDRFDRVLRERLCRVTVEIIQVADAEGNEIFTPAGIGDRIRPGRTTGMHYIGRYWTEEDRRGGMSHATQSYLSASSPAATHRIIVPETAQYRVWTSTLSDRCRFTAHIQRTA